MRRDPSAISRMPIQILRPIFAAINYRVFGLMGPEVFHIGQGKDRFSRNKDKFVDPMPGGEGVVGAGMSLWDGGHFHNSA